MTPTPLHEAPATDSVLLSFDGRVLEVFGCTDAARYRIWEEPRLEFRPGRSRRLAITTKHGGRHSILYDPHRLVGLQALADRLARSRPEGPEH